MFGRVMTTWLIDDEDFEFNLVERTVRTERLPVRLRYFAAATEARDALDSGPAWQRPQLIMCDVKMPGMDGFEFLRWLRSSAFRCTPVILRSNSDRPQDITRAYEVGANAYHTKPLHMDGLAARMRATFQFWFNSRLPDPDWGASMADAVSADSARRMGASHLKILRVLAVGFSAKEISLLQTHPAFLKKLDEVAARPGHTDADITELCRLGGELLARSRIRYW